MLVIACLAISAQSAWTADHVLSAEASKQIAKGIAEKLYVPVYSA